MASICPHGRANSSVCPWCLGLNNGPSAGPTHFASPLNEGTTVCKLQLTSAGSYVTAFSQYSREVLLEFVRKDVTCNACKASAQAELEAWDKRPKSAPADED